MHARRETIVELLRGQQRVHVRDLARQFDVSEMTIRRDLDELAQKGFLVRTYGGGKATAKLHFVENGLPEYSPSAHKTAIGKLAASLVAPGQTIMVDSGTTTLEVVRNLRRDPSTTVATVSLWVAQELFGSDINVVLVGGSLRTGFPGACGTLTEKWLSDFRVDVLFISCDGADSEDGFYLADVQTSSLVQAMIRIAGEIAVVAESAKFGKRAFVRYAQPSQVRIVVTDAGLPPKDRKNLEERGVRVLIAEVN